VEPYPIQLYAQNKRNFRRSRKSQQMPPTQKGEPTTQIYLASPDQLIENRTSMTTSPIDLSEPEALAPKYQKIVNIPIAVYEKVRSGFIASEADRLVQRFYEMPDDRVAHLGDPFGQVFAWIWSRNRDEVMLVLADYLADIRHHPRIEEIDPPITFDEILKGLRPALPHDFPDYDIVIEKARHDVRSYYGKDPFK
jgi:hypothetical protein